MIRPTGDRIVIQMDDAKTETASGLLLSLPEASLTGTVVAVGPGAKCPHCGKGKALILSEGDTVILGPNTPVHELTVDGVTYTLVKESEILAVYPQEQTA